MPKEQIDKIQKVFTRRGGVMQMDSDTDAHLRKSGAEGAALNGDTILLMRNPSRATVFEELIHNSLATLRERVSLLGRTHDIKGLSGN